MKKLIAALMAAGSLVLGGIAHAGPKADKPHGKACGTHGKAGQHGQGASHGKAGQARGKKCDVHGKETDKVKKAKKSKDKDIGEIAPEQSDDSDTD